MKLKDEGIHTALQTCGYFEYATFKQELLPWLDLIMYDLKLIDSEDHLRYTGQENKMIVENFSRLLNDNIEVVPRIPLIPGFTTPGKNLAGISDFLKEHDVKSCSLLPYNPFGLSKWERLGKTRSFMPTNLMQRSEVDSCHKIFSWAQVMNL
jgi:pyruvate formate lyase activating enzyme